MGDYTTSTPRNTWKGLVRLPRLYKEAARILTSLGEEKGSLYNHLSVSKHTRTECLASILTGIVRQRPTLEAVLKQSKLLEANPGFNHELALVLVYELLFSSKKTLPAGNNRVNQVLACREAIEKALRKVKKSQEKDASGDDAEGLRATMLDRLSRGSPLKTLLIYTVLMVTVPITAFFMAQWTMGYCFDMSITGSSIGATIISVLCVHVILAMFVYEAYREDLVGGGVTVAQKED